MLIEETKKFLVDTEKEAADIIADFKARQNNEGYSLSKAGYVKKVIKSKGEIIGETWTVTVTMKYE